ncbi:hypothetical protein V8G54_029513, partial [Vigna mungo]
MTPFSPAFLKRRRTTYPIPFTPLHQQIALRHLPVHVFLFLFPNLKRRISDPAIFPQQLHFHVFLFLFHTLKSRTPDPAIFTIFLQQIFPQQLHLHLLILLF